MSAPEPASEPGVRLVNRTTGALVAARVERARSFGARPKGLLGRDGLPAGDALAIEPCNSIHTFFMRFPIDVLFLANDGRVVRAVERLPPWRATRIYPQATQVVELAAGSLAKTGTVAGHVLEFE